jgi:hypothetical protein
MGFDTGLDSTSHQPWCIPPFLLQDQWDAQMRREVSNDLSLVRTVLADLQHAGFEVLLIGGWAEELQGVTERRVHQDVDVVLLDPPNDALEAFVAEHDGVVSCGMDRRRVPDDLVGKALLELAIGHVPNHDRGAAGGI